MYTENHMPQIWAMVQIQTEKLKNPIMTETGHKRIFQCMTLLIKSQFCDSHTQRLNTVQYAL